MSFSLHHPNFRPNKFTPKVRNFWQFQICDKAAEAKQKTMTKINIKGYSLKYHTYVFNVYNSSNYKTPILKKVNAPMLESAVDVIKKKYPNYSYNLKKINA